MNRYGQEVVGYKDGALVYASCAAIAQLGVEKIRDALGLTKRYPVKINLSGGVVMVKGNSHEDALRRWINRNGEK